MGSTIINNNIPFYYCCKLFQVLSKADTDTTAYQDTSSGEQVKVKSEDSSVDTGGNYCEENILHPVNKDLTNDEKDGIDPPVDDTKNTENKDEKTDVGCVTGKGT